MSPLRYCDDFEFDYDVADTEDVRLSYSLGSALYAVRADLTALYAQSDEPQQIGSQFISVFGRLHGALCRARSNKAAASKLRAALIDQLCSARFANKSERDLRNRLVTSLRAEEGAPVADPFRVIFRYAAEASRRYFGDDWPGKTRCTYQVIGDQPFPGSRFWVNAFTALDLSNPASPPSVCLRVHPNQLNVETYSAIYAILVHECFCHVPAHRVRQTNESPFSEGFCDWAASKLFDRWLRELDPSLQGAARLFGQQIWTAMMTKGGGNKFWYTRVCGHQAAEKVISRFMDAGAAEEEAINLVITLARELVVVAEPLAHKDSFVREIAVEIGPKVGRQLIMWRDRKVDARTVLLSRG